MVQANGEQDARRHGRFMFLEADCIRNFMPSWFAVNMGTGAVSSLLWSFPYGPEPLLHALGTAFLVLNVVLFMLFLTISAIRFVRYPEFIRLTYRHPVQSLYLGCLPMGFATIINSTLNVNQGYGVGGQSLLYVLWGLWWLDSVVSLGVYFLMIYTMITRHNHSLNALTAIWLLPAVTPIVPATTGALLARAILPHSTEFTIVTLFMSLVLLFLGLSLNFMILPVYVFRLITQGLPENSLIVSKFLPVGPCGQGGAAFVLIGQVFADIARRHLSSNILLDEAQPWALLGTSCGFFLWTFGIWWISIAVLGMYETLRWNPPNFAVGFWGMVFPLGVYAFLTLQLSYVFESHLFRGLAAYLSVVVFSLWTILAVTTIHQVLRNRKQLFSAHDLPADESTPPWDLGRSEGHIRI